MKKAIVFFADGFEECEGLVVVDILRRAGIKTTTASVMASTSITSAHNITLESDILASEANFDNTDILVLPGGIPGTYHLRDNKIVRTKCTEFYNNGKYIAAICAAPIVFSELGFLKGKDATCYPSFEKFLTDANVTHGKVEVSGNVITGQALGAAIPFGLAIVEALLGKEKADEVSNSICF